MFWRLKSMGKINLDITHAGGYVSEHELNYIEPFVKLAHEMLHDGSGAGSDFTGWLDLPGCYDVEEFNRIKDCAAKIRSDSDVLVVIGIGGSYLGARAAIDALSHSFYNQLAPDKRNGPAIIYAGNSISSTYFSDVLEVIENKNVSLNVVSKSGTTTEPALAFRALKEFMENKYGKKEAAGRIYATTDKSRGALKKLSDGEGYQTFVIPDDVGGRYSVLTAVGLLPIAAAGIDIDAMMEGAGAAMEEYSAPNLSANNCYTYAAARNILYRKGKTTEILVNYEPGLHYFNEWWKQLYGESEGKDGKGIFPAAVDLTTDLHSMGQYIQDGVRNIFETALAVGSPRKNLTVKTDPEDMDGLNFLSGKDFDYINKMAAKGTIKAHVDGGVPNIVVEMPKLDAASFGSAVYFFEKACAISGYLLGVNPFNQPGVETYKRNMFELLGKPGY
jgi:glucose-6-phosphate isomerase